jgi:hypothetical protein
MACKNVRDSYKLYKKSVDNSVELKEYILYANEYNKFLVEKVLDGHEVTLPVRFGTLCIIGRKQKVSYNEDGTIKGLAPDWVKTKQLWENNPKAKEEKKLLYHINSHTDNTIYRFLWSKKRILTENKILYSLKMTRDNKRVVHNLIKKGKQYITKFN